MSLSSNLHEDDSHDLFREVEEYEAPCDNEIEDDEDEEEEEFPITSIRVLIVDADLNSSLHLKNLMTQFSYQVTNYENGEEAMDYLKKTKDEIDLVIWDFHNLEINGVEALKTIRKEMDLPVVIISNDYEKKTVKKSTKLGACDFLVKPVSKEVIAVLWQHVFRKKMSKTGLDKPNDHQSDDDNGSKNNIEEEDSEEQNISDRKRKKPRMTWTPDLHKKFEEAIRETGNAETAYPKQILKYMRDVLHVEGLTRNNVASHLQKYRLNSEKKNRGHHQEDSGWRNATLTAPKPFLNPIMEINARLSYNLPNDHQTAVAAAAATAPLIQYPLLNGYNHNHFMPNNMPYIDPFHQPQPQQPQQQQYQYSSPFQLPNLVNKQESGYIAASSAMENLDPLIYKTSLPYDLHEYLQQGYNDFDQNDRYN